METSAVRSKSFARCVHSLHMEVIAEGVETEGQARMLQRLHCDRLHGYLISRPVPEAEPVLTLRRDPAG